MKKKELNGSSNVPDFSEKCSSSEKSEMMKLKTVGIIGASGFTGYELIKILMRHDGVQLKVLNSQSYAGKKVSSLYPDFAGDLVFTDYALEKINALNLDLLFLCMPNGEAMKLVPQINAQTKIIDLSADYRFAKKSVYEEVYGIAHRDKKTRAVYGLPELHRAAIQRTRIVANPGCYATACILAAMPLVKSKLVGHVVFDGKSGYSGAGRESAYAKHPELLKDNIIPYKLTTHRHTAEIAQCLNFPVSFTPHVLPHFQGLMITMHAYLKKKVSPQEVTAVYADFYKNEPFISLKETLPTLHDVQQTNKAVFGGFEIDAHNRLVVISVLDNLIKGASGQAVQNMNLMLGFEETRGLLP